MPRRDLITINNNTEYGLNVFDKVGPGGANNPGDVLVIQAMFRYLHELHAEQGYIHPSLEGKDVEVNGIAGYKTFKMIRDYQRKHWWALLSTDGVIHPARYENRKITTGNGKRLMTITHLHLEIWLADNTLDYTTQIASRFPNVAFWIR